MKKELEPILDEILYTLYSEQETLNKFFESYVFWPINSLKPRNKLKFEDKKNIVWTSIRVIENFLVEFSNKLEKG